MTSDPHMLKLLHLCVDVDPPGVESAGPAKKGALDPDKLWSTKVLRVAFLGGDAPTASRILAIAEDWTQCTGIAFQYEARRGDAHIRIAFAPGASWSFIGTDALAVTDENAPTLNLGWLTSALPDNQWRRVVLHEFGHALGMIHEHMSPSVGIRWKKEYVREYFSRAPYHWDSERVDRNILERYQGSVEFSEFDPRSIMLYPIPAEFTEDGYSTPWNDELSEADKAFMANAYSSMDES